MVSSVVPSVLIGTVAGRSLRQTVLNQQLLYLLKFYPHLHSQCPAKATKKSISKPSTSTMRRSFTIRSVSSSCWGLLRLKKPKRKFDMPHPFAYSASLSKKEGQTKCPQHTWSSESPPEPRRFTGRPLYGLLLCVLWTRRLEFERTALIVGSNADEERV